MRRTSPITSRGFTPGREIIFDVLKGAEISFSIRVNGRSLRDDLREIERAWPEVVRRYQIIRDFLNEEKDRETMARLMKSAKKEGI